MASLYGSIPPQPGKCQNAKNDRLMDASIRQPPNQADSATSPAIVDTAGQRQGMCKNRPPFDTSKG